MTKQTAVERTRRRNRIVHHLDDLARQFSVLELGIAEFEPSFDAAAFARAFESDDPRIYQAAQLLEGALTRVQGHVARLAGDGARLAGLELRPSRAREVRVAPAFEALARAGVMTEEMARRLVEIQEMRNRIEHVYVDLEASDVFRAIADLARLAPDFVGGYTRWIEPFLRSVAE